jgi:LPXTG-motif cell wall-anchored protein
MRERLYRSRRERVVGGLAGGLARNLGIDVTWVRLGWVVLAFATQGVAILIYLVLLFVIPEAPDGLEEATVGDAAPDRPGPAVDPVDTLDADPGVSTAPFATASDRPPPSDAAPPLSPLERLIGTGGTGDSSRTAALVVGIVLVAAGAWLLIRRYVLVDFELGWPVVAIGLGAILVLAALRTGRQS